MIYLVVVIVMLFCAIQSIRASNLMTAALWLASASALLATLLYGMGAPVIAVIELSVGAGLVTVLFIFAISLAGDEPLPERPVVPKALALVLVISFAALLVLFSLPLIHSGSSPTETTFSDVFWHERSADALAQIVLIFTGALSVLGFLAERHTQAKRLFVAEPEREVAVREEQQA